MRKKFPTNGRQPNESVPESQPVTRPETIEFSASLEVRTGAELKVVRVEVVEEETAHGSYSTVRLTIGEASIRLSTNRASALCGALTAATKLAIALAPT